MKLKIHKDTFIAPNAYIIGDVTIEKGVSIWYGAVIRGDIAPIKIGENSNIQDNSIIHVSRNSPVEIGKNVTIGHGAIVHGAKIRDNALIGMGAVILNDAIIGEGSVISAQALVKMNENIPKKSLVGHSWKNNKRKFRRN